MDFGIMQCRQLERYPRSKYISRKLESFRIRCNLARLVIFYFDSVLTKSTESNDTRMRILPLELPEFGDSGNVIYACVRRLVQELLVRKVGNVGVLWGWALHPYFCTRENAETGVS